MSQPFLPSHSPAHRFMMGSKRSTVASSEESRACCWRWMLKFERSTPTDQSVSHKVRQANRTLLKQSDQQATRILLLRYNALQCFAMFCHALHYALPCFAMLYHGLPWFKMVSYGFHCCPNHSDVRDLRLPLACRGAKDLPSSPPMR